MYTNPPIQKSALEEPNLLVGSSKSDWQLAESWTSSIVSSRNPPQHTAPQQQSGLSCPGEYIRLCLLLCNRHAKKYETKKYGPNERTEQSSKNRTKRRRDSQPIRCRIQNTGNRMLTEMVECGCKIKQKVKAMKSEIKENVQGTNSEGKETEI